MHANSFSPKTDDQPRSCQYKLILFDFSWNSVPCEFAIAKTLQNRNRNAQSIHADM